MNNLSYTNILKYFKSEKTENEEFAVNSVFYSKLKEIASKNKDFVIKLTYYSEYLESIPATHLKFDGTSSEILAEIQECYDQTYCHNPI